MCGHFGNGAIDQKIVARGLDDRRLGIVRHEKMRRAAGRLERMCMGADLINEGLHPSRSRKSEARRPAHGDENLRRADFAGQPVERG